MSTECSCIVILYKINGNDPSFCTTAFLPEWRLHVTPEFSGYVEGKKPITDFENKVLKI